MISLLQETGFGNRKAALPDKAPHLRRDAERESMNKLVYLFELDSVRTTQQEIEKGQNAMFEEIARNGNTVVLSLNQLTDSRAFMAAVENKYTYPHILELFKAGAIRISYYGNKRTPSQYIQEAIEKCNAHDRNTFIFSALPVLCTENDLLETIHTALRYSDPSLISELSNDKKRLLEAGSGNAEELGRDIERLDFLERYVRMILLLSTERLCGNKPIGEPTASFSEYMERVLRHYGGSGDELILEAAEILRQVGEELSETDSGSNKNNRSAWVKKLYEYEKSDPVCMAEAVCDLCYNFTIEESILNVSRHFNPSDSDSFFSLFDRRLWDYWNDYKEGNHVFHEGDRNDTAAYTPRFPHWVTAVRMYAAHKKEPRFSGARYEQSYGSEKLRWKAAVFRFFVTTSLASLFYILILVEIDLVMEELQEVFFGTDSSVILQQLLMAALSSLVFGVLGSAVTLVTRLPDFLDAFRSIYHCIEDVLITKLSPKNSSFRNTP